MELNTQKAKLDRALEQEIKKNMAPFEEIAKQIDLEKKQATELEKKMQELNNEKSQKKQEKGKQKRKVPRT
ncbi:MAG: hypothetical protein MUC31_04695 [Bacteroidales bacterium]|nr:hypothetical protein [Bacteroidales bacterium]